MKPKVEISSRPVKFSHNWDDPNIYWDSGLKWEEGTEIVKMSTDIRNIKPKVSKTNYKNNVEIK